MKKCKICKLPNTGIGTKHFHCSPPNKKSKVNRYYRLIISGGEFLPDWVDEVRANSIKVAARRFREVLLDKGANWFPLSKLFKYIKII